MEAIALSSEKPKRDGRELLSYMGMNSSDKDARFTSVTPWALEERVN